MGVLSHLQFGWPIAFIPLLLGQEKEEAHGSALVRMVADAGGTERCHVHGPSQPAHSELACASVSAPGGGGFRLSARLARGGAEPGRRRTGRGDLRNSLS